MKKEYILILMFIYFSSIVQSESNADIIWLSNSDFKYGTYIINRPGTYKLTENIVFNPNSVETLNNLIISGEYSAEIFQQQNISYPVEAYEAGFPLNTQFTNVDVENFVSGDFTIRNYDSASFGLGFFAAIVITGKNITLDLNGFKIVQSEEHALLQRFFSVIELAEQPFIPREGPSNFGDYIRSAENITIKNGTIGRSAHHGIHGNGNKNIKIKNVDFVDYEVSAIALNGVNNLEVINSQSSNRKDVPVLGIFSSAQFIKPYVEELYRKKSSTILKLSSTQLSINDIRHALKTSINNTHEDIIVNKNIENNRPQIDRYKHPVEYSLFSNPLGVIDGNSYSYLVNKIGAAVDGFPYRPSINSERAARNIVFNNVHVLNQGAFINEIIALKQNNKAVIDPVGSVFQTQNIDPITNRPITISSLELNKALYVGNVVANAQAFIAKAYYNGEFEGSKLDLSRLNISKEILNWIESKPNYRTLDSVIKSENDLICNGDSMFHVDKGVIGFKIDAAINVLLFNTSVRNMKNLGKVGSTICGNYLNTISHPAATLTGYGGTKVRGYTFSGSKNIVSINSYVSNMSSKSGSAISIDVLTNSKNIFILNSNVDYIKGGLDGPVLFSPPNEEPNANGIKIGKGAKNVYIFNHCTKNLLGYSGEKSINDNSSTANVYNNCKN